MPAENDVPLGEGARRYYEQQFGDRIRQVRKGGRPAPRDNSGSNGYGRAGCGVLLGVFVLIRIIVGVVRTQSTPTYNYTPPQPPQFKMVQPNWGDKKFPVLDKGQPPAGPEEFLRQQGGDGLLVRPDDVNVPDKELLTAADVPLLGGLCYRIYQESQQPGSSPGKRIYQHLPAAAQQLLVQAAGQKPLGDKERDELIQAFAALLQDPALYDGPSFARLPEAANNELQVFLQDHPANGTLRFNRLLLEKCYPRQIIPLSMRPRLNDRTRALRKTLAEADLEVARKQFEPQKP